MSDTHPVCLEHGPPSIINLHPRGLAAANLHSDPLMATQTATLSDPPFSQVLQSLADLDQESITLKTVVATVGTRIHGTALLLLALPEAVPLPIPSASFFLGFPLLLIAGHLLLFGERSGLPARVNDLAIPRRMFGVLSRYVLPTVRVLERISGPRWPAVAGRERAVGLACVYLAVILILPLPFINALPAILLAIIAWGMIQRDGLVITVGLAGSALLTLFLLIFANWLSATDFSSVWSAVSGKFIP